MHLLEQPAAAGARCLLTTGLAPPHPPYRSVPQPPSNTSARSGCTMCTTAGGCSRTSTPAACSGPSPVRALLRTLGQPCVCSGAWEAARGVQRLAGQAGRPAARSAGSQGTSRRSGRLGSAAAGVPSRSPSYNAPLPAHLPPTLLLAGCHCACRHRPVVRQPLPPLLLHHPRGPSGEAPAPALLPGRSRTSSPPAGCSS